MHKDFESRMFDIYLDSITNKYGFEEEIPEDLPQKEETSEINLAEPGVSWDASGKVLGSIRELAIENDLICYVVVDRSPSEGFLALKASQFTRYAFEDDTIISCRGGKYLAELENSFILADNEVETSVVLDYLDTYGLMELQKNLEEYKKDPGILKFSATGLDEWKSLFRIKEHELTLPLRYRNRESMPPLWIPQLELQQEESLLSELSYAASSFSLSDAFKLMRQNDSDNILHTISHTLRKEPNGNVTLHPAPEYDGKKGRIYCGAFCVFKGFLPKTLYLNPSKKMSLSALQSILDIRIEIEDQG